MNKYKCASLTFAAIASGILAVSTEVVANPIIIPVGDSITRGFAQQVSYRAELDARLTASGCSPVMRGPAPLHGHPTPHAGYSGRRADHFINGAGGGTNPPPMSDIVGLSSPAGDLADAVLMHMGTNDILQGQSVSSTLNQIQQLIDDIHTNQNISTPVYIANVVPWYEEDTNGDGIKDLLNPDMDALSDGLEANYSNYSGAGPVYLVDVRTGFRPTDMTDGIHPSEDDITDPRSDSGEHKLAVAFAAALEDAGDCLPSGSDTSFPLTDILTPAAGETITGALTIIGKATDTGGGAGGGFSSHDAPNSDARVRLAIRSNTDPSKWWNFRTQTLGGFSSTNAHILQGSVNYADWRGGFPADPGNIGNSINLPTGDYTLFALAIDEDKNQNYFNQELWPERTQFFVNSAPNSDTPTPTAEVSLVHSCLAGSGRFDVNVVNTQTALSTYTFNLQGQSPRTRTVAFENWGRIPITGRPPGSYTVEVLRDGVSILSDTVQVDCSAAVPPVSTPEVTIVNACVGGNGFVLFQMVNPTNASRPYVVEFEGVRNRSNTAAAYGQAVRGTSGRPDGVYSYKVRSGSTTIGEGSVEVDCD